MLSIEIQELELEQRVRRKLQSGRFQSVDELLTKALDALEGQQAAAPREPRKNLAQFLMESPLAGAELDLERGKQYMGPVEL
jgi:Arc/MetJ-type ribon-helix-helix transcriptional regulator